MTKFSTFTILVMLQLLSAMYYTHAQQTVLPLLETLVSPFPTQRLAKRLLAEEAKVFDTSIPRNYLRASFLNAAKEHLIHVTARNYAPHYAPLLNQLESAGRNVTSAAQQLISAVSYAVAEATSIAELTKKHNLLHIADQRSLELLANYGDLEEVVGTMQKVKNLVLLNVTELHKWLERKYSRLALSYFMFLTPLKSNLESFLQTFKHENVGDIHNFLQKLLQFEKSSAHMEYALTFLFNYHEEFLDIFR